MELSETTLDLVRHGAPWGPMGPWLIPAWFPFLGEYKACLLIRGVLSKYQWIGLREIYRKAWFLQYHQIYSFPVNFPIIQFYENSHNLILKNYPPNSTTVLWFINPWLTLTGLDDHATTFWPPMFSPWQILGI